MYKRDKHTAIIKGSTGPGAWLFLLQWLRLLVLSLSRINHFNPDRTNIPILSYQNHILAENSTKTQTLTATKLTSMNPAHKYLKWSVLLLFAFVAKFASAQTGPYQFTTDDNVCVGQTKNYGVTLVANSTYAWTISPGAEGTEWNLTVTNNTITVKWLKSGNYTISVIETNEFNCSSDAVQLKVFVHDLPVCSIDGPDNICPGSTNNYSAPDGMSSYNWSISGNATISGASNGQTVSVVANKSCGTFILTLIITNANGCSSTCTQTFVIKDTEKPVVSTTATNNQDLGCNPTVVAPVFTGLDNCDGVFTPVVTTAGPTSSGCNYTQTWTANYKDACGNDADAVSITYTWKQDTEKPVVSTTATNNQDLGCNPTVVAPVFTGLDNCDGVFTPVVTTAGPTSSGCNYTQTWTANYKDACGNDADAVSITYTWKQDTEKPVVSTTATNNQDLGCNPTVVAPVFTGLDNCDGVFTPVVTTAGPTSSGCNYTQTWTANYKDACGNDADAVSITYTWKQDTEKPVVSTTATNNQDLGCNPTVVAPVFTGLDNCDGVFTPVVTTAGPTSSGCNYTQTWTANYKDACGNDADAVSITYTWKQDTEKPVVSTTATNNQDLGCNPTVVAPVFTGLDNCDGVFTPVVTTAGPTSSGCNYTQTWTANYKDACGNDADAVSITYTWKQDTEKPVVSTTATNNQDLGCNPTVVAPVFTGLDNCDGVFTPVVTTAGPTSSGCNYTQTWTANYKDACGNDADAVSITYTWKQDTEKPVVSTTATNNQDLGCNPTVVAPVFTGLDNCDGVFTPVVTTAGPTSSGCNYTQTWTANYKDACGNDADAVSITYTWKQDTEKPVVSTTATNNQDLGCNPTVVAPVFTGLDNCDGVFTPVVTTAGPTSSGCNYTQTWTANYKDACGNDADAVSITYTWKQDTEKPVVSTTATNNQDLGCNPTVVAPVFTGLDNCDGVFTPVVTTAGPTSSGCNYTQTWTANYKDACGNDADAVSITYTWKQDTEKPVVSTTATNNQDLGCNPTVVAPVFTGLDNCDGVFTPVVTTAGPTSSGCNYTQTWTANYKDACGNDADAVSITYTWKQDTEKPVVSTTATNNQDLGCNPTVVAPVFTGLDNCDGVFTPVVTTAGPTSSGCNYTQTWTANYKDACGNDADAVSITYTWKQDTEKPVVSTTATNNQDLGCNPTVVAPVFTGLDNCDGVFTPVVTTAGPTSSGCNYTQTWTANYKDACGNDADAVSITYTWKQDTEKPVVSTTATNNQDLGCNPTVVAPVFTGLDNCDGVFTPVVTTAGPTSSGCNYTQTWTANYKDACGNDADAVSITYTWKQDTEKPVVSTTATNNQDLGCNPTVVAPVFTGLDNCDGVFTPVVTTAGPTSSGCNYTQTWTANYKDACGNDADAVSITYTWKQDTEKPVVSTTATNNQDLGCNPTVVAPVFTGLDNCDGVFTPVVTTAGPTSSGCNYTQTWTANYKDACGNDADAVSITYTWKQDTEKPVVSTTATNNQDLGCNPTVVAPVFTGLDNCDGVFTPVVTTAGPTSSGCNYTQTWTANYKDACGNDADAVSITYTWKQDTEKPVVSTTATNNQDLGCNPTVVAPVFTGLDNCDGVFTPVVTTAGPTSSGCNYTQTWTANYKDACGNDADAVSITYTWKQDTEKPVVSTTATNNQDLGCNPTVVAPVFTGLDNCDGVFTPVVTTAGPTSSGCNYTQTWTANYKDACGNDADAVSITYTWKQDTEKPVVSTTATNNQDLGCNPTVVAPVFTGLDNCDGVFTPVVTTAGPTSSGCNYTQTWTANYKDACGNDADAVSITYTWKQDTEKPVVSTTATNNQDLGCNPTVVAPVFTGLDNCDGVFTPVVTTAGPTSSGCNYTQTWTANYKDACGNDADAVSITYTWKQDTEKPVVSTTATNNQDLGCNPTVVAPVFTGLDNCDGVFTPVVTTAGPTSSGCNYTQTWTANYKDACGNDADAVSITYTWKQDTEKPVVSTTATNNQDLGCNPTVVAPVFTGLDNCDGVFTPVVTTAGPTSSGCNYTQTWTANYKDACGNDADAVSITYTWKQDTEKPVVSTTATNNQDLGCNPTVVAPVFTGLDNCDGVFTPVVTTAGPTSSGCNYTQTWTANYKDACGNDADAVSITYTWKQDTEKPVVSTTATNNQDLGCNPTVVAPVFTGLDNCDGVFTPVVTTAGPTSSGCNYTQTWTANYKDACGNDADAVSITYTWKQDTEKPVVSTTATNNQDLGCNPTVVAPVFTGLDNCDGVFTPVVTTAGPTSSGCNYTQTWTANYKDACGNDADAVSITYTWKQDTEKPVVSTTATNNQDLGCNPTVVAPVFTGLDNCDGVFTPVVTTAGPTSSGCNYTQTWTANYKDACGNDADAVSITYTWKQDTEKPVVSTTATNNQDLGCNPTVVAPVFTGLDNCDGVFTPVVTTAGPTSSGCNYTQTWTANYKDACGNDADAVSITYTWKQDTEKPVIDCPKAQTFCVVQGDTYAIPKLTASDNCSSDLTVTYVITGPIPRNDVGTDASGIFGVGTSIITWTVIDGCGNSATCSTTVTINPLPDPIITGPDPACVNTGTVTYSVTAVGCNTYSWTVSSGGTIIGDNTGSSIVVEWTTTGTKTVTVTETVCGSGCTKTVTKNITVNPKPVTTPITHD